MAHKMYGTIDLSPDRKGKQPTHKSLAASATKDYRGFSTHDITMMSMKPEDNYTPLLENG